MANYIAINIIVVVGINLVFYKTLAFAVSAFYAGIAGGLYAFALRFIDPELFSLFLSIMFLTMAVVGAWARSWAPLPAPWR